MDPDIHCVTTHWIRGFIALQLARGTRIMVLMVPAWPKSGFRERAHPVARLSAARLRA